MGRKKMDEAVAAAVESAEPAADELMKVDIMPFVLIQVQAEAESEEDWDPGTIWPDIAPCPPEIGDMIQPTAGTMNVMGEIIKRVHTLTEAGPVLLLIVKSCELD